MFQREGRIYYSHLQTLGNVSCCVELEGCGKRARNNVKCFLLDPYQVLPDWKNVEVKEELRRAAGVAKGRKCPQPPEKNFRTTVSSFCVKLSIHHESGFRITTSISEDGESIKRSLIRTRTPIRLFGCQYMPGCAESFQRKTHLLCSTALRIRHHPLLVEELGIVESWGVRSRKDEKNRLWTFKK